ncbi:MAG: FAD-dependent oxidoreductase [Gammaproteobacteria bacterium]
MIVVFNLKTARPIILIFLWMLLLTEGCVEQISKTAETGNKEKIQGKARQSIDCNILIIGGGMGGLYTAYQLGKREIASVCLFELEARLGGRILDVSFDGKETSPRIGVGARRILSGHALYTLAKELGIDYEEASNRGEFIFARGRHTESNDELAILAYPSLSRLNKTDQNETEVMDALYQRLQRGTRQKQFPDFISYVRDTIGAEGYHYLLDASRFRSDFQYPIDTASYLDWLKEEAKFESAKPVYPNGGMSEFVRRMAKAAGKKGVKFFTSQPVKSLRHNKFGYVAVTPGYQVNAKKIIIAVNAAKLESIQGDVIETIVNSPQYQQLLGIPVVTVTQWWSYPWWKKAFKDKEITRLRTIDHCINLMEIPTDEYGGRQLVTRTVYSDEMSCVALWQQLNKISTEAVEAKINRELTEIFPRVKIPRPLKTYVKVWPDAWYWLKAGTPYTNCDIADWATKPVLGEPVYLVGESYNPQRSTWSDGAVSSSSATLNAGFGFNLPQAATALICESTQRW